MTRPPVEATALLLDGAALLELEDRAEAVSALADAFHASPRQWLGRDLDRGADPRARRPGRADGAGARGPRLGDLARAARPPRRGRAGAPRTARRARDGRPARHACRTPGSSRRSGSTTIPGRSRRRRVRSRAPGPRDTSPGSRSCFSSRGSPRRGAGASRPPTPPSRRRCRWPRSSGRSSSGRTRSTPWRVSRRGSVSTTAATSMRALAIDRCTALGLDWFRGHAMLNLALSELALGRCERAVELVEEVHALLRGAGVRDPDEFAYELLVEALVRLGRDDAAARGGRGDGGARRQPLGDPPTMPSRSGAAALVAEDARAPALFEQAIAIHPDYSPFELARTHLLYGERLRRMGERRRARDQLRAAAELFERLGADWWAERCRRELAASGARLRKIDADDPRRADAAGAAGRAAGRARARRTARSRRRSSSARRRWSST